MEITIKAWEDVAGKPTIIQVSNEDGIINASELNDTEKEVIQKVLDMNKINHKLLTYTISSLSGKIQELQVLLATEDYSIAQRANLEKKLEKMKLDLAEFHALQ